MNLQAVGRQIAVLRKEKGLTQSELGERLGVTFQAVSNWERGETLPDTAILPELAQVLETSVDLILAGGERSRIYRGRITVQQMKQGLQCLWQMGQLLGRENLLYRIAVDGINAQMNTDVEEAFRDEGTFECFLAEAIIQNLLAGKYIDRTDVNSGFQNEHYRKIVLGYCDKFGIR